MVPAWLALAGTSGRAGPTQGFLDNAAARPFKDFYDSIAGAGNTMGRQPRLDVGPDDTAEQGSSR